MIKNILVSLFLLSMPLSIVSAIIFNEQGGLIIALWFAIAIGLTGFGAVRRFREELSWRYGETTGIIVEFEESVRYEQAGESITDREYYYTPIIEYTWEETVYRTETLVGYGSNALRLSGRNVGDEVVLRVPIECPEQAREKTFFSVYVHLFIGIVSCSLSLGLIWMIVLMPRPI